MTKILIISDSHLNNEWIKLKANNYDYIIHAGDHQMSSEWMIKNTDFYVDGNNDWGTNFKNIFEINNYRFLLIHGDEHKIKNKENWSKKLKEEAIANKVDIVIYGHTHIPSIKKIDYILYINPGSIAKPKFPSSNKTYCILEIDDSNQLNAKICNF